MPLAARLVRALGKLFLAALVLTLGIALLPALLTAATERLVPGGTQPLPPSEKGPTTAVGGAKAPDQKSPSPSPVGPPDCAHASASEVAKAIGRKVQPIAVSAGCAWGTRLDDPSTTLVAIRMSPGHGTYDTQLTTSVKQSRVVFGGAPDANFRPATALWVATGQPITKGKSGIRARADTHVVVSRFALGISDDRARQMAVAIAAAANGTS